MQGLLISTCHGWGEVGMVLIAYKLEVRWFNFIQPFWRILPGFPVGGYPCIDGKLRRGIRLACQLFFKHGDMIFINMRITNEVVKPARCIPREPTDEV